MTGERQPRRLGVDHDGLIVPPSPEQPLSAPLAELVQLVMDRTLRFPVPPHSIYLQMGEEPAEGVQLPRDVDVVVVLREPLDARREAAVAALRDTLAQLAGRFGTAVVGLETPSLPEVERSARRAVWHFWLRHCCRCVFGEHLAAGEPRQRPSWAVAHLVHGDIGDRTQEALDALIAADAATVRAICRATTRRLVWAGFGLVMAYEESWTTDLDRCCELFLPHHPRWQGMMPRLIDLARHPDDDRARVSQPIQAFGSWLATEYARLAGFGPLA